LGNAKSLAAFGKKFAKTFEGEFSLGHVIS
jgi:hypothetical protein